MARSVPMDMIAIPLTPRIRFAVIATASYVRKRGRPSAGGSETGRPRQPIFVIPWRSLALAAKGVYRKDDRDRLLSYSA
jgi:hypothetical protein